MGLSVEERKAYLAQVLQANKKAVTAGATPARRTRRKIDLSETPEVTTFTPEHMRGPVQICDHNKLNAASAGEQLAEPSDPPHVRTYLAAHMARHMELAQKTIATSLTPPQKTKPSRKAYARRVRALTDDAIQIAKTFICLDLDSTPSGKQLWRKRDSIPTQFREAADIIAKHNPRRQQRHLPVAGTFTPSPVVRRAASASNQKRLRAQTVRRTPLSTINKVDTSPVPMVPTAIRF